MTKRRRMELISRLSRVLLMLGILVFDAQGQIDPVSMLGRTADRFLLGPNPSSISGTSGNIQVHALTEIPFGLPVLQSSWLSVARSAKVWSTGFLLSRTGFDQLKETGMGFSIGRKVTEQHFLGLQSGVLIIQRGELGRVYRPFWALGATIPLVESVLLLVTIQKKAQANQGLLSPSRIIVGGQVQIATNAEITSQIAVLDDQGVMLETLLTLRPIPRLFFELGHETSRSMIFGGLTFQTSPFLASVNTSWHPVLGMSTSISVAWHAGDLQ